MLTKRKNTWRYFKFIYVILYILVLCITVCIHWLKSLIFFFYISLSYLTWVIAAAHLYLSVINAKDPASRIPYICGGLHLYYIISPRPRDVEIAPPVTGIKTCLGREHRGGTILLKGSEFPSKIKSIQYQRIDNIHVHLQVLSNRWFATHFISK